MKTIITHNKPPETPPYPKLMISAGGRIVLMIKPATGMLVGFDKKWDELGKYSTCWAMDDFKDFTGSVTLSN